MNEEFHDHLDECAQCRNHPMQLCRVGVRLLYRQAFGEPASVAASDPHAPDPGKPTTREKESL